MLLVPLVLYATDKSTDPDYNLSKVAIDKAVFNPTAGERVKISFHLTADAKVSLNIYDADRYLIAALAEEKPLARGDHAISWNGKDQKGKVVPDEAYFFIIEALRGSKRVTYDPAATSGGVTHDIERVKFRPDTRQLEYELPETGRVSIRVGLLEGPLMAIPVDWEPRAKGWQREPWDGLDQEKLVSVLEHPKYHLRASYFSLPQNTVITQGNQAITFLQYKSGRPSHNKKNSALVPHSHSILQSPLFGKELFFAKAPLLEVTFSQADRDEKGLPVLPRQFSLKTDLGGLWADRLRSQPYELYFYLDGIFLFEIPQVHLPYETALDLQGYPAGMHVLTVNLKDLGGQIGIKSTKIKLR